MKNNAAKKIRFAAFALLILAIGALFWLGPKAVKNDNQLHVFAASSFAWAINENQDLIEQETGLQVVVIEAASSTLARQIIEGAPADIFITADMVWLEYLTEKGLPKGDSQEIARNGLGLAFDTAVFANFCSVQFIAQPDAPSLLTACPYAGRVATGDPEYVPLGKYAGQAMELYEWDFPLAPAPNARAALALFEEGALTAGIFYTSDIVSLEKPVTWFAIPPDAHGPIAYWAVALKDSNEVATENFLNFLKSGAFRTILMDKGFETN